MTGRQFLRHLAHRIGWALIITGTIGLLYAWFVAGYR